jgi:anti-sigma-K factor RskA
MSLLPVEHELRAKIERRDADLAALRAENARLRAAQSLLNRMEDAGGVRVWRKDVDHDGNECDDAMWHCEGPKRAVWGYPTMAEAIAAALASAPGVEERP